VLVATDVAARGIHVDDIDLVIQADAPDEYKTYLHRAGRTGRAGKAGRVVTLIPRNRQRRTAELLSRAEIDVDFEDVQLGDEMLVDSARSTWARRGARRRRRRRGAASPRPRRRGRRVRGRESSRSSRSSSTSRPRSAPPRRRRDSQTGPRPLGRGPVP
jgi:superfamily II DNA/RNA helicase